MLNRLVLTLLVALAYAATGWLALQATIAPYYVSLVFIPAGVALGAVLVRGWSMVPGVVLGSLAVQAIASGEAGLQGLHWNLLVSPLGAGLQAGLTAWAVRRWAGYPGELDTPKPTLLFLLVIVPLGHLLNASVSVPLLLQRGVIEPSGAWFSWWSWWQGDALGAVLFTPLVLVALGQPAAAWRPRWKTVALPLMLALAVVGGAFHQVKRSEEAAQAQRFQQESDALTARLQRRLNAQTDSVLAVTRVMELVGGHSAAEFTLATTGWLERYTGTQNFGWSPYLLHAHRESLELAASAALALNFEVRGRTSEGGIYRAPDAEAYLPIRFVEPLESNASVLGLDVLVLPATARAVQAAMVSGLPQVTEGLRLVQERGEQRGVVMYQAAFAPEGRPSTGRPNTALLGVVSAVFRMDDVLQAAVGELNPAYLQLCLIDPAARNDNQRLSGPVGCSGDTAIKVRHFSSSPVRFGERTWLFQVASGPAFEEQGRGWLLWGTLTVSLMAVALLGVFLVVITGQTRRTEKLVELRTQELALSNAGLRELAHFDPLTGLANRSHWLAQARAEMDAASRHGDCLAVVFVDLDHFKDINDGLGHGVGDELLQTVAQRLLACLRSDDVLARQGGDEFVVLLNRLDDPEDAAVVAAKMVQALSVPVVLQGHEVRVSASLGLDWFDGRTDGQTVDVDLLLRHADTAMYAAKAAGRNGWRFFSPEMDHSVAQRLLVETGLRRALAQGELRLHYQPQVNLRNGRVVGVEALVRWQHPELGLLGPDRFIPQAEHSGLIDELGRWVLREACGQLNRWRAQGMVDVAMAVNVSAVEFSRANFTSGLRQVLAETGVSPEWLELEVTETALMLALPELVERLGDIKRMGVSLSLDDFGTGYSSLGYLKRLPLGRLKIDRSFVSDLPSDKEDEAIVRATLSMAHALGLEVVAEGVETEAQREFLTREGCDHIQGWLVAKPMAAEHLLVWWRQGWAPVSPD